MRLARLSRLVGTRFQVLFHSPPGVLFTFPSRYSSAIGHQGVFRLSGWSRRIHTEFHGLGATWETCSGGDAFSCTGLSPSPATPSRGLPLTTPLSHSPSFPPHALCVQARVTPHDWCRVPPFGNPRINARLTAPRGLSHPPTSFIGSWCQGIHRAPLTTWPHKNTAQPAPGRTLAVRAYKNPENQSPKDARVHCAVLNVRPDTGHPTPPDPPPPQGPQRYAMQTGPARQRPPRKPPGARSLR